MSEKTSLLVPGALDLTEQAVHLLRRKGISALADYYIGTLPFILGLLYFWSDMSRNADAHWYCAPAAAAMALLFIWMKLWHVRYCRRLWCILNDAPWEDRPLTRYTAAAARQSALQATGMVILPVAAIIVLPMGWVYAFYQNLSVMDAPRTFSAKQLYKDAVRQATLWPGQNHLLLGILSVFGIFVLVNVAVGLIMLPYLLKWILGIETAFTLSGIFALANTTFLMIVCALTYLCIDPLIKAVYTLRCFLGSSRQTGDDLRAALKPFLKTAAAVFLVAGYFLLPAAPAHGAASNAAVPEAGAEAENYARRLDES
ncbi:MAG: hypothetical protein KJP07_13920, partial [Desulfatitalea sp.]|nr:hypothetical protein [Desulfatitalea sp.]